MRLLAPFTALPLTALTLALVALPLALASCLSTEPSVVPLDPPVVRTLERVLGRHDLYVGTDPALSVPDMNNALQEAEALRSLASLPSVSGLAFGNLLEPVADRHDAYVAADVELDDLERAIYLQSTVRLRSLVEATQP